MPDAETTTVYGIRWQGGDPRDSEGEWEDRAEAERLIRQYPHWNGALVQRTVTVSPWVEVQA